MGSEFLPQVLARVPFPPDRSAGFLHLHDKIRDGATLGQQHLVGHACGNVHDIACLELLRGADFPGSNQRGERAGDWPSNNERRYALYGNDSLGW